MKKTLIDQLAEIVGTANITTDPEELLCYSYDGSAMEYLPAAVLFPGATQEISAIMRCATDHKIPVVPRGAGSGMTGGALPVARAGQRPGARLPRWPSLIEARHSVKTSLGPSPRARCAHRCVHLRTSA